MPQNENEPKAIVKYEWSADLYRLFNHTAFNSVIDTGFSWFFIALLSIGAIMLIPTGDWGSIFLGLIFAYYAIIYTWYQQRYSIKAVYKSYKAMHGLSIQILFHDNYLIYSNQYSIEKIPYDMLYQIKSSKYGYALLLSKCNGIFVPKGECPKELIQLIENIRHD